MKRSGIITFFVAGALLALTGCSSILNGTSQVSTRSEKSTFDAATEIKETEINIEPGMVFHTLLIRKIRLTAGTFKITLIGPDESVVWEESFADSADFDSDLTFDSLPGKWILRIELTDATGSYDLVWRAGNTP